MTNEQLEVCYEINDCSICPYGKADTDYQGNFKNTYSCDIKLKEEGDKHEKG